MNLLEFARKAEHEALRRNIKANSILLNEEIMLVRNAWRFVNDDTIMEYPPMICGLSAYLTDELPDDFAFAIFRAENLPLTREQEIKQQARDELLDELREMSFSEVIEMLHKDE